MENENERTSGEGFRRIGGLLPPGSSMPETEASIPTPKSSNSETTTSPRARSSPTSMPPGGRGLATRSSSPPSVWQNDQSLQASLPELLRTSLRLRARYDSDFDQVLGYDPLEPETEAQLEMVKAGLAILDTSLAPAPRETILKALARLKLSVNPRNQDPDDARYQRAIYVDELSEFPQDVVAEALLTLGRRDWFPNVGEARDACQHLVRWRRVTRDALARAIRA